jgi:DNA (cytosine-5)-methyltransferase 1
MIRLGTLFSGIGAVEQALNLMNINHVNVFACDNGELEKKLLPTGIKEHDNLKRSIFG